MDKMDIARLASLPPDGSKCLKLKYLFLAWRNGKNVVKLW